MKKMMYLRIHWRFALPWQGLASYVEPVQRVQAGKYKKIPQDQCNEDI